MSSNRNGNGEPPPSHLPETLDDRFRIIGQLGAGSSSTVYKAEQLLTKKVVALKLLHGQMSRDEKQSERFRREARVLAAVEHPGVVQVFDLDTLSDGRPFLVMEYLSGLTLAELIKKEGALAPERAVDIFKQILAALQALHNQGIIHRDLKPSNVFITGSATLKLLDFGIAKILQAEGTYQQLTQTGEAIGSPAYMSPEHFSGKDVDARSDIYSMGCLMYEALTGRQAFQADSPAQVIQKQIDEAPPPMRLEIDNPSVAAKLERIVFQALAKNPRQRYQTAAQMQAELNTVFQPGGIGIPARLASALHLFQLRSSPARKRHAVTWSLILAVAMLAAITAVAIYWSSKVEPPTWDLARAEEVAGPDWPLVRLSNQSFETRKKVLLSDNAVEKWTRTLQNQTQADEPGSDSKKLLKLFLETADEAAARRLYQEAIKCYGKVVDMMQLQSDGVTYDLLQAYLRLAECYYRSGQLDAAEIYFLRVAHLELQWREHLDVRDQDQLMEDVWQDNLTWTLIRIAEIQDSKGNTAEAAAFFDYARTLSWKGSFGKLPNDEVVRERKHGLYALATARAGDLNMQAKDYRCAAHAYDQARTAWKRLDRKGNKNKVIAMILKAVAKEKQGSYKAAEKLYDIAAPHVSRSFGANSKESAFVLSRRQNLLLRLHGLFQIHKEKQLPAPSSTRKTPPQPEAGAGANLKEWAPHHLSE